MFCSKFLSSYLFILSTATDLHLLSLFPRGASSICWTLAAACRVPLLPLTGLSLKGPRCAQTPLSDTERIEVNRFTVKRILDAAKQAAAFLTKDLIGRSRTSKINRQFIFHFHLVSPARCHRLRSWPRRRTWKIVLKWWVDMLVWGE